MPFADGTYLRSSRRKGKRIAKRPKREYVEINHGSASFGNKASASAYIRWAKKMDKRTGMKHRFTLRKEGKNWTVKIIQLEKR